MRMSCEELASITPPCCCTRETHECACGSWPTRRGKYLQWRQVYTRKWAEV